MNQMQSKIEAIIKSHPVVIFMKGTPEFPQCGFSAKACQILRAAGVENFHGVDVFENGMREAVKAHTQWPTIPQIFIHGNFVGGCDILFEMYSSGELASVLKGTPNKQISPSL